MLPAGTYVKTPDYTKSGLSGLVVSYKKDGVTRWWQTGPLTLTEDTAVRIYLQHLSGAGPVDKVVYPMLVKGTQLPSVYEKPGDGFVLPIPAAVQALEDFGQGVDVESANVIEFSIDETTGMTRKFYRRTSYFRDLTNVHWSQGNPGWFYGSFTGYWSTNPIRALSSKFVFSDAGEIGTFKISGPPWDTFSLYFHVDPVTYPDLDSWKAALKEWSDAGAPLTALVAFEDPSVTDITDLFPGDNFLQLHRENPNILTFENENAAPVVAQITFDITA